MSINRDTVLKTAKLARLRVDEQKIALYMRELSNILDVVDTLRSANTKDIEPLVNVNEFDEHKLDEHEFDELDMTFRKDIVTDGECSDKIFQNAPKEKFDYFIVPKVVE